MKRWLLFGGHPYSGGWDEYCFEFDTRKQVELVAREKLSSGWHAQLLDQQTQRCYTLRLSNPAKRGNLC